MPCERYNFIRQNASESLKITLELSGMGKPRSSQPHGAACVHGRQETETETKRPTENRLPDGLPQQPPVAT